MDRSRFLAPDSDVDGSDREVEEIIRKLMGLDMDLEYFIESCRKGFRIALGTVVSLTEILQDPEKRDEIGSQLQVDLERLADEFSAKGEAVEQEARQVIERLLAKA